VAAADVQVSDEAETRRKSGIGLMEVLRAGGRPVPGDRRELVFLVHGMGRTPLSMFLLGRRLERAGYRVASFGYLTTTGSVADLGTALGRRVADMLGDAPRVHFVGHSLGNIIVRWLLAHERPARAGRVVMLAPPNQGAAVADRWARWVGWAMPQIHELRTLPGTPARSLPLPPDVDVGIVAGLRDAKVRVHETQLEGARDHAVVPGYHTFIMNRADVHRLVCAFLRDGRFSAADARAGAA
jgi:alpha-beta hydrolase superfamily lysophospholipase